MNQLNLFLALTMAYFVVSVGSVLLSMRTNIGYLMNLMSMLYIFIAIGLVLLFINMMETMPTPLNPDYFIQTGKADALAARHERDHALSLSQQLVPPDVFVDYAMLRTLDAEKREASQREAHASIYAQRVFKDSALGGGDLQRPRKTTSRTLRCLS